MTHTALRRAARGSPLEGRANLYAEITVKIIAELEAGRLPWVQPWASSGASAPLGLPKNAATGRQYSGINVLILWNAVIEHGYAVQSWLTFRQALLLGGHVRKGERGTTIVYADHFIPEDAHERARESGEEPRAIPFLKRFTVFNAEQCEGLPDGLVAPTPPIETNMILPQAEALIRATGADIRIGGDRATTTSPETSSVCRRHKPISSRSIGTGPLIMNSPIGLEQAIALTAICPGPSVRRGTPSRN